MTVIGVAPPGFRGTTKGARPQIFVPITMRGVMEAPWAAFENRRSYWAYLFARLKPGVTLEEARTGINAPYRAIINNVEAAQQGGMSEADAGALQSQAGHGRGRLARPEHDVSGSQHPAHAAAER